MSSKLTRGKKKTEKERKKESQGAGEIVSSKLVKYMKDVDAGFNTALATRAVRGYEKRQSWRYLRHYPAGRSGSASGTNKSSYYTWSVFTTSRET